MARKAIRNTYGFETVAGVEVRRLVIAGSEVPEHYRVDEGALESGESPEEPTQGSATETESGGSRRRKKASDE